MKLSIKYLAEILVAEGINWKENNILSKIIAEEETNSEIHEYIDEMEMELNGLKVEKSKIHLIYNSEVEEVETVISYVLNSTPNETQLKSLIEYTTGQLSDGYGEEPWIITQDEIEIGISLIGNKLEPLSLKIDGKSRSIPSLEKKSAQAPTDEINKKAIALNEAILDNRNKLALNLINAGVDVNIKCPLISACQKVNVKLVKELLKHGASVNVEVFDEAYKTTGTPLIWATNRGNLKILEMLINHGAEINYQRKDGMTAIFHAREPMVTKFLIKNGANVLIEDLSGKTAKKFAKEKLAEELESKWKLRETVTAFKEIIKILEHQEKNLR